MKHPFFISSASISWILVAVLLLNTGGCSRYVVPISEKKRTKIASANGFVPNADTMLRSMEKELAYYGIRNGDCIADVGAGSGWFEGVLTIKYDSLKIDAVDVKAYHIRESGPTIEEFIKLRSTPNTNVLTFKKGKNKSTQLPKHKYDKVIVRQTFHHFEHKAEMLADLRRIMKVSGKLYVYEPVAVTSEYFRQGKCYHFAPSDLLHIFSKNGFKLVEEFDLTGNPGNVPPWIEVRKEDIIPMRIYVFE